MAERQAEANAIFAAEADERRRQILSPPPIAPSREGREPIRLGGGLMVRGDRHINYRPQAGGGGIARTPNTPDRSTAAEPLPRAATQQRWDQIAWNRAQAMRDLIGDNILVGLGYPGIGGIMMGGGAGGAGPAGVRREDDIQTILSKVEPPKYEDAEPGFTQSFDLEDIDAKFNAQSREPIEIDEDGNVIPQKKKQRKSYLVCANCSEPLLVSSAYRGPEDRVWMLRCGHLIDQRCLDKLSTPTTEKELARVDKHPDILGAWEAAEEEAKSKGRAKKTRAAKRARKEPPKVERRPDEYAWRCEVEGCGMEHKSEEVGGVWKGVEGEGAVAVYA
ncbi:hypothetical protein CI109_103712 [Kwoniella shandongensis]|uniref:Uncharacterized protein n=1 Tax=Kwoniella shandongensis TaxID=1734106 RepID=A0A5M6C8T1_9TREE|nr:uncharacterized protein CI109_000592 [Kwoniella shandongensis]KAA5531020.1 hypothetical protein CI109_000592 [Kwoniella shandongensis]